MNAHIKTCNDNCEACNKCVTHCPVEANKIVIDKNRKIKIVIIDEKCIQCGECVHACQHNARYYIDSTEKFFHDIAKNEMAIIVAPAIFHNFKN